ncbi:hypothetical protein Tco_0104832 [Tanacetum coccineum]
MAWLRGRVALGSFPDLAGAVNKISESVKNIEKNFDNALASTSNANDKLQDSVEKHGSSCEHESEHDPYEKHESLRYSKEVADAEIILTSDTHFMPVREASIETVKPVEHHDEVKSIAEKPMDTKTDMAERPVETSIATSDKANGVTDSHTEAEADSQTRPSVDDAVEKSADQVETTSPEINDDVQTASNLQKSEHESNINDKVTTPEEEEMDAEPLGPQTPAPEMNESVEGQSQLLTSSDYASEVVSNVVSKDDNNENAEVHIEKEHHTSLGSNLLDNADSTVNAIVNNSGVSLVLQIVNNLPLVENADSEATEEAWTLNISYGLRDRTGN